MAGRFVRDYGLGDYDATQLTQSLALSEYFEVAAKASGQPKLVSNWVTGEISRRLNAEGGTFEKVKINARELAQLVTLIAEGTISNNAAKALFDKAWSHVQWGGNGSRVLSSPVKVFAKAAITLKVTVNRPPEGDIDFSETTKALGLEQMNDTGALEAIVDTVIAANAKNVAEFKGGNEKALNALVGQIMKASQGKANPQQVNDLLRTKLA